MAMNVSLAFVLIKLFNKLWVKSAYLTFQTFPGVLRKWLEVGKICHLAIFHETNYHKEVTKICTEGLAAKI